MRLCIILLLILLSVSLILILCLSKYVKNRFINTKKHLPLSKTAFYINMDRDKKRNIHTKNLLSNIGFTRINRVTPIPDDNVIRSLSKTHKYVVESISKLEKEQYYFIFEDDIAVHPSVSPENVFKYIEDEMKSLINTNMKIPFMYLGSCLDGKQAPRCTTNRCKCWCAHAYIVTPQGAKWLLNNIKNWEDDHADYAYMSVISPPLIGYKFTYDHIKENWRGLFYQARDADWYSSSIGEKN